MRLLGHEGAKTAAQKGAWDVRKALLGPDGTGQDSRLQRRLDRLLNTIQFTPHNLQFATNADRAQLAAQ
jgi:hypothetical protein